MGAKTANGEVKIELPGNAALVTGEPLVANLVKGDVVRGTTFEDAVLGETDNAIPGMEFGIHALDDIANQRRFIIEVIKGPQNTVAVTVSREGKVLLAPDSREEVRVVSLVFKLAATGHMLARCQLLSADFHIKESSKRRR